MPFPKPVAVQGGWQVKESPRQEQDNPVDMRSVPRSAAGVVTDSGDILDRSGKSIGKLTESGDPGQLVGNAVTASGDILDSSGNVLAKATLNEEEGGEYTTEPTEKDQKDQKDQKDDKGWDLMGKGKSAYQTASNLQKPVSQGMDLVSRMQKPSEDGQSSPTDSSIQMSQGDNKQPQEELEGQEKTLEKAPGKEGEEPISMEDKSDEAREEMGKGLGKDADAEADKLQEEAPKPMEDEGLGKETAGDLQEKPDETSATFKEGEALEEGRELAKDEAEEGEGLAKDKAEEGEEKIDFSELKGTKVNKAGNLVNKQGDIIGRLVEGDPKQLIGKRADENGNIWNDEGKVIGKAEPLPHHERGDEKDFAPFENFPDAVVEADGRVMFNGQQVGVVVEGDAKHLKGSKVDEDGDILDRRGNVVGKAEAWNEPEAEPEAVVDKSSLAGKRVNKAGNVVDGSGAIWGRVIEGNIKALVGRMCDKEGNVLSESGDVIGKAELVGEGEREGMKEGPFAELSGCTVAKDGTVVTPSGDIVGRLTEGDPKKLFGRQVDEDGDVVDSNGNVLGKAERWEPEEVERKKAPYAGRKVNREGNVLDEEGNLIAKLVSGDVSACSGKEVDEDGDVVNYKGDTVGHVALLEDIPKETEEDIKKREEAENDRKLASKLAGCIEQSLDKIRPICKMITDKINTAERTPKEELDEEQLVREVKPLIEEGGKILTETNGTIRGLDPDGRIQRNAKHKAGTKEASPEEYHLADVLKELTGTITQTIDNAKSKIEGMPHAKKELNPLWGLLSEPLFQIIAAVGLLLTGVLGLVGKLLSGLGLGGILDNLLGTLGLNRVLDGLGLGGVTDALTGKSDKKKK
ncbi:uncharacterized protein T069G_10298 [Trichoderma breve]|uniref:DUF6987 domain-containing protein n=1 Tax=Trichoderma breve TaxID=2034170 RepID=A0A9W9B2U8_9HYPO|nr:uncharacterized protein T069G_10298 [Trichoderma breve]KAJ4854740.1 hypothetical protein T069G_10298 [Trichoderma breve]